MKETQKNPQPASAAQDHQKVIAASLEDLNEPGCYVDEASGDLFRIPKEVAKPSPRRLRQLSTDPYLPTLEARHICIEQKIKPNF